MFIEFWKFFPWPTDIFQLNVFFLYHKFAHFVHALGHSRFPRFIQGPRFFFLTTFPGPMVIPCPISTLDSRVDLIKMITKNNLPVT